MLLGEKEPAGTLSDGLKPMQTLLPLKLERDWHKYWWYELLLLYVDLRLNMRFKGDSIACNSYRL